jgi:predicted metal-dependent enzyme (double-stranded beta helix superfamily)
MWAVIGVYTGREDNIFWRRLPGRPDGRVETAGARAICAKDAYPLGPDIIHSVTNPCHRRDQFDRRGYRQSDWNCCMNLPRP